MAVKVKVKNQRHSAKSPQGKKEAQKRSTKVLPKKVPQVQNFQPITDYPPPPVDKELEKIYHGAYKEEKKLDFLIAFRETKSIAESCRTIRISPTTYRRWIQADDVFNEAVQLVRESNLEELEAIAWRMCRKENATILTLMLKAHSAKYRNLDKDPESDPAKVEDKGQMAALMNRTATPDGKTVLEVIREAYRGQDASVNGSAHHNSKA